MDQDSPDLFPSLFDYSGKDEYTEAPDVMDRYSTSLKVQ